MRQFASLFLLIPLFIVMPESESARAAQVGTATNCGNSSAMGCIRTYIEFDQGSCSPGAHYNAIADNLHTSRAIRATFRWRNEAGNTGTSTKNFEAGERHKVIGSCATFTVTGASFLN